MSERSSGPTTALYPGIFFLTFGVLLLEIGLTRIFSVTQGYHFAFMVISISLLGLGASGSVLMLGDRSGETIFPGYAPLLFGFSVVPVYLLSQRIPWDPVRIRWEGIQAAYLALDYVILAVPFFFAGWTLAWIYRLQSKRANRVYFADLLGAGAGAVASVILPRWVGGEGVILAVSAAGFLSARFLAVPSGNKTVAWAAWGGMALLAFPLLWGMPGFLDLRLSPYRPLERALSLPGAERLMVRWNSYSRVDLVSAPSLRTAPGLSLGYDRSVPNQLALFVNGGGQSPLIPYPDRKVTPAEIPDLEYLDHLVSNLPYVFGRREKVFVIEPRGGGDILMAHRRGAGEIVGLESNPLVLEVVREYAPGIFQLPGVAWRMGNPRRDLVRSGGRYDCIVVSLLDPLESRGSGIHALTEDHRLTVEAIGELFRHLAPGGVLAVSQYLVPPPRAELRMASLLVEAVEKEGGDPARQIVAARSVEVVTQVVKRGFFRPAEIEAIGTFLGENGFAFLYYPGINAGEQPDGGISLAQLFPRLVDITERARVYSDYLFDVRPVSDDRPFFHQYFRLDRIREVFRSTGGKWSIFFEGGYLLPLVFLLSLMVSLAGILLPQFAASRGSLPSGMGARLGYFACIGFSFIVIEVTLIQKWVLLLGHPGRAIPVVIAAVLIAAGAGSAVSGSFAAKWAAKHLTVFLLVLGAVVGVADIGLDALLGPGGVGSRADWRPVTVAFIFPIGFFLGMPFPLGIRLLFRDTPRGIPWAWAVNGFASVSGSVAASMLALAFGFSRNFQFAAAGYGLAGILAWRTMVRGRAGVKASRFFP